MKIDDIHEMANDINKYVNEHHMLKSLNQQLFSENERLNAIIDELEERIDKATEYIKTWVLDEYSIAVIDKKDDLCCYEPKAKEKLLKMLGDKNE